MFILVLLKVKAFTAKLLFDSSTNLLSNFKAFSLYLNNHLLPMPPKRQFPNGVGSGIQRLSIKPNYEKGCFVNHINQDGPLFIYKK